MTRTGPSPRIAYVAWTFPVLTQTFTLEEIAALRRRGLALDVFRARRGDSSAAATSVPAILIPGALSAHTLGALATFALRRPLRLVGTFASCLAGGYRDRSLRLRAAAPVHFLAGVALAKLIRAQGGFTRVHAQFVDAGSTAAFVAARLLDLPFSFANHTAYNPFLLPVKARHADLIVSITEFDRAFLLRQADGAADETRIVVSRVGIDLSPWREVVRRPEPRRVLAVGALREKKGHAVLLEAAAVLRDRGSPVRLVFAGGGPAETALRGQAARLRVETEFLGPTDPPRVRQELARAALFALPCVVARNGDLDGLPVAIMEAMAAGVPVISTRLSGIPELVDHERSGLLVPPGDVNALADALDRMLGDAALAARCATGARLRVAEHHDIERTSARLAALLSHGVRGVAA